MMWGARSRTVFEVCFVIRIVESLYLQETGGWTPGETSEWSADSDLSEYDWTTSADVTFTRSTFLVTNSTPHGAEVTSEPFDDGDSTWEGLGSKFEVSTELTNPSYTKQWNDYSQFDSSTTSLSYTGNFESTYVTLEEVAESTYKYLTVYRHTEAVTEEAAADLKHDNTLAGVITSDSSANSKAEHSDIETDSTTTAWEEGATSEAITSTLVTTDCTTSAVEEESTAETVPSTLVSKDSTTSATEEETITSTPFTTGPSENVSAVEDQTSADELVPPPAKDWHTLMTVTLPVVGVSVVCLVVLTFWKLRRPRQYRSVTAMGDVEIFYRKPREPVILKEELMLYVLSVHLTRSARAKILGEDHPVTLSPGQQEFVEEVTSL